MMLLKWWTWLGRSTESFLEINFLAQENTNDNAETKSAYLALLFIPSDLHQFVRSQSWKITSNVEKITNNIPHAAAVHDYNNLNILLQHEMSQ